MQVCFIVHIWKNVMESERVFKSMNVGVSLCVYMKRECKWVPKDHGQECGCVFI